MNEIKPGTSQPIKGTLAMAQIQNCAKAMAECIGASVMVEIKAWNFIDERLASSTREVLIRLYRSDTKAEWDFDDLKALSEFVNEFILKYKKGD
jgi:hypothetical protein